MSIDTSQSRWWLALDGRPDGPRTTAYVTAALQSGSISLTTPICAEGGNQWQPLGTRPEFAAFTQIPAAGPPPLPPEIAAMGSRPAGDRLLTNPLLPPMANLICIYSIIIAPLYWIFNLVFTLFAGDNPFLEGTGFHLSHTIFEICDSLLMLGVVVMGVLGGIFLKMLGKEGAHLVLIALSCDLVWSTIYVVGTIALLVVGAVHEAMDDSPTSTGVTALSIVYVVAALILFAFKIVATIWLIRCRRALPLT